jgi:hypothetical protein
MAVKGSAASAAVAKLKKQAGTKWKTGVKNATPGGGQFPGVPQGTYVFQCTSAKFDLDKNKNPYALVNLIVADGQYKGKRGSKFYGFKETEKRTVDDCIKSFAADMKCLGFEDDQLEDPDNIPDICEAITEHKPKFHGKLNEGKDGFDANVWFNDIAADDSEELEEEEETEETEEEETSEEETTEEETEEEVEEEEAELPVVGNKYACVIPPSKKAVPATIVSINKTTGTCFVKHAKGKTKITFDNVGKAL